MTGWECQQCGRSFGNWTIAFRHAEHAHQDPAEVSRL